MYDVIVIGAGHAGCEAALASARLGAATLVVTMSRDTIAQMPCNPAIGGLAKGNLVKEIDALGGEMGKAADATGIQFRVLNASKGAAARGSRCQSDMDAYKNYMRRILENQENLSIVEGAVEELIFEGNRAAGVTTKSGKTYHAKAVVITTGTFLNGLIHRGEERVEAGRYGEEPAKGLSLSLAGQDLRMGRLKTGTPARLDKNTIDWDILEVQPGDDPIKKFSFWDSKILMPQIPCHITYTNEKTHQIIHKHLHRSSMYSGAIKGVGPRYCPSIEDKIVRFADKNRHQIFLEPTTLDGPMVYPNGLSTSLPAEVQEEMLRSIEGLEDVKVLVPGYAIEYDFVMPNQLKASLESKDIEQLFCAGQINGTSGYEEAAAQGIMAGINAALTVQGREAFVLNRSEAYIGVLIDDLITKGTNEPYRMFTSRAEYRLTLREDNADLRLAAKSYDIGLLPKENYLKTLDKQKKIQQLSNELESVRITPNRKVNQTLAEFGEVPLKTGGHLKELLKRPSFSMQQLKIADFSKKDVSWLEYSPEVEEQVEIDVKYAGYISRQSDTIRSMKNLENIKVPENLNYELIVGLSREIVEKLKEYRPMNLGQAHRISGVTPAAINIMQIYLRNHASSSQQS